MLCANCQSLLRAACTICDISAGIWLEATEIKPRPSDRNHRERNRVVSGEDFKALWKQVNELG